jgi:hypothetical protein
MSIDTTADIFTTAAETTAVIDSTPAETTAAIPSRTVYVTADPDRPPYDYVGRHRRNDEPQAQRRPARRGRKMLAAALSVVGITLTIACSGTTTPDAPPLSDSPAASSAAKVNGFTDGQYRVGSDVKPGTYTTTVRGKASDPLISCYWARLKSFDGDMSAVLANGNLAGGAHGRMTVKASDVGVEFSGGCVWAKAANR